MTAQKNDQFLATDEWRDIVGYEGLYKVHPSGKVSTVERKIWTRVAPAIVKKPYLTKEGYCMIRLSKDGKSKATGLHRLVAMAFIPNPENKPEVDHIDGNPANNSVENLRWVTPTENRLNPITRIRRSGKNSPVSRKVRCIQTGDVFDSLYQASEWLGLSKGALARSLCKKQKCGGYDWEYLSKKGGQI